MSDGNELSRTLSEKVMSGLPGDTFRLLFALLRYSALRPDEALDLRWSEVNWRDKQLHIRSRKTGPRISEISPEVEPLLRAAHESRRARADHVLHFELPWLSVKLILRQHIARALRQSGQPMPPTLDVLRSSRMAELSEQS